MTSIEPSGIPIADRFMSWRILVPGWSQWAYRDVDRARVFFGTFASALLVGLFAWGSRPGFVMIALAFLVHVVSASDAIQTCSFPGFGRWVPPMTATFGLGFGCYLPTLAMASMVAWPQRPAGGSQEDYLVNSCAYRTESPQSGDWIWYTDNTSGQFGLGRMVAGPGQVAEWSGQQIRVDGNDIGWMPKTMGDAPIDFAMEVPKGFLLVAPSRTEDAKSTSNGLRLLPRSQVRGRPWAQVYPIWSRRLLW